MSESTEHSAKVMLVDPSRFTAPYDAGLSRGLLSAGAKVTCWVRPLREGEQEELPPHVVRPNFYGRYDRPAFLPTFLQKPAKALSHLVGLIRLVAASWRERADIVHFQWAVLPVFDALAICVLRLRSKVVLTVHDTVPFNGQRISFLQNFGFDLPIRAANTIIVHTTAARDALIARGTTGDKVHIVPHGPLSISVPVPARRSSAVGNRFVFTLFGQLKPYKGLDVLVEAIALVRQSIRSHARFIVAGAAFMDMAPIVAAVRNKGLGDVVELRVGRLTEQQMAKLFQETDCFLFPYRQIDASGVFFLTAPMKKWIIASSVGAFADYVADGKTGTLVPPADSAALAEAIADTLEHEPVPAAALSPPSWDEIGSMTLDIYRAR